MRALLDVNVLIALLDQDHSLHQRAKKWFTESASSGWASCPLTQNGCIRIMAHASYPNALPITSIIERLRQAVGHSYHQFWPDNVSLLDEDVTDATRIHGPRQITDLYLLALAVSHGGCLVTFDTSIALSAIKNAAKKHLIAL